jgi:uncharacterized protein (TIGR03437 family)
MIRSPAVPACAPDGPPSPEHLEKMGKLYSRNLTCLLALVLIAATLSQAQSTHLEQNDPTIQYKGTWYGNSSPENSAGAAALTNEKDAAATLIFHGTGITWTGFSDQWSGLAWVYLDGTLTIVDTFSAASQYRRILFAVHGLSAGSHNLTIQVPHQRGPGAQGSWVWIDGFEIDNGSSVAGASLSSGRSEQNSAAVTYLGLWYPGTGSTLSGGTASMGTEAASLAAVTFTGTGISWIGFSDPWSGIAKVSLDGSFKATVDTYNPAPQPQKALYTVNGLTAGTHSLTIEVTGTHNAASGGSWIWLDAFDVTSDGSPTTGTRPAINSGGLVNAASLSAGVAAGSIVSLFGTGMASSTFRAASLPLPTMLGTSTVRVNGVPAPLFYASPTQINFQVPWELAGQSQLSVSVDSGSAVSLPLTDQISALAPGIFSASSTGSGQGAVIIAGTAILAAPVGAFSGARPATRGEFVSIYCTGLGAVSGSTGSGSAAGSNPLSSTTVTPTVQIGGVPALVTFSGLAPGFAGLYQVNVQVPAAATAGSQVPVVLTANGVSSNTVTIAIQ